MPTVLTNIPEISPPPLPLRKRWTREQCAPPEPDLIVLNRDSLSFPRNPQPGDLRLFVEISDSTLNFDLTVKAGLYARAGIVEFWVLDINGAFWPIVILTRVVILPLLCTAKTNRSPRLPLSIRNFTRRPSCQESSHSLRKFKFHQPRSVNSRHPNAAPTARRINSALFRCRRRVAVNRLQSRFIKVQEDLWHVDNLY